VHIIIIHKIALHPDACMYLAIIILTNGGLRQQNMKLIVFLVHPIQLLIQTCRKHGIFLLNLKIIKK